MKERPILFSAPMVRAILAGRKTQTRRVVKLQGGTEFDGLQLATANALYSKHNESTGARKLPCPYGAPGDRLWVRETWGLHAHGDFTYWHRNSIAGQSGDDLRGSWEVAFAADALSPYDHWRPSIHMPRWASRITLEVTHVRVDRLLNITCGDAVAEGIENVPPAPGDFEAWRDYGATCNHGVRSPISSFASLWRSINGPDSWNANPWVWVVNFKRVTP